MDKTVKFKGSIIKCVYNSPDFKTYACDVDIEQYPNIQRNRYNNISIIGELPELTIGVEYEITGIEKETKYGISYKVIQIRRDIPTATEDVHNFLCEILTENQAKVLIEHYPSIIQKIKDNDLADIDLSKLKGIGEKTFDKIKKKIVENFMLIDIVAKFKGVLSFNIIKKIYDRYSSLDLLEEKLKSEPYTALTRISGIGFKTADAIIIELQNENIIDFGYDVKTSVDRCLACLIYLLYENENEGNTKTNLANIRAECIKITPECADHFAEAIKDESIYYNKETMDIALKRTYDEEHYIAETLINTIKNNKNVWDYDINKYKNIDSFELSDEQMQAVNNVCKYSISILNGAAGTGKSQSTKAIINMLKDYNKSFVLFAPTGKASKVLSSYTNEPASTIHRGLGYNPSLPNSWTINKENQLKSDVVIIDEFSMVDVDLFKHVIDAIDFDHTKLLIIGDNAQLPSVSCGNLLHDFMQTKLIPTTTLTKVFRYSDGGLMQIATKTRFCETYLDSSMKSKATIFGDNKDYMFVDLASDLIPKNVVALYKKLLDAGNNIENIQVLTAKNVGDCGTVALNNMIQKIANKNYGSEVCMKVGDTTYYVGDLVIETKNNYKALIDLDYSKDKNMNQEWVDDFEDEPTAFISNGDVGIIKEIYKSYAVIDFDGIFVRYYRDDMNMIKLGYSISIHKSQGGSFDNIILCTPQSHAFMLNSNLIYVGLTRMKKKCYHLGTLQTVNQAIHKKENFNRLTFMQEMLLH